MLRIVFILSAVLVIQACNSVKTVFKKEVPPYEAYVNSLEEASLLKSPMARAWIKAGQDALTDSVTIDLPFSEAGFFAATQPEARSYRFEVKEGQVVTIEGLAKTNAESSLFLDLFVWKENQWAHLSHGDSTLTLVHEFGNDASCLLRTQPELLIDAYYTISINTTPVLVNPVSGANNRSIRSFYGDQRDGGRRAHEGLDIFAPRGTPVIAPTAGTIYNVGTNNLGGKVVWMRDSKRGHTYYFAHLDSQLVTPGKRVVQGDTLGLVGNTGNARTTPPHLHFGIYQRGSKDPINYIRQMETLLERVSLDTTFQAQVFKVATSRLNMRRGPGQRHEVGRVLAKNNYVKVVGQSGEWYRITLPDNASGFVAKKLVVRAEEAEEAMITKASALLSAIHEEAVPVAYLPDSTEVEFLADYQDFNFVKTEDGRVGWISKTFVL